jgi:hypothetical protein
MSQSPRSERQNLAIDVVTSDARFTGSLNAGYGLMGLTPQALCYRLLRRLSSSREKF